MSNTAEITHKELQTAREAAGLHQYQVAALLNVSEDTISRWERGLQFPTPEQVDELEKLYKAPGLWYGWMRWHHKSFRDRYPEHPETASLALAMVNAEYQLADLRRLQEAVIRDALDGKIDDPKQAERLKKEGREAYEALGTVLALLEGGPT